MRKFDQIKFSLRKEDWKVFGLFFIFIFILFFFISSDSYTHDLWYKNDSAWFYMCGKAWMNGMIPYVDFSDSKGPLLFLIYGIGYLLSPRNYLGIFWISVFWYAVVFFINYKTVCLFVSNNRVAIFSSFLMALALFMPYHDNEFRAEDMCVLFISSSLYSLCKVLYVDDGIDDKQLLKSCFVIGVSLGATFLIKYSNTAMLLSLPIVGLIYLIKTRQNLLKPVLSLFGGLVCIFLPFLVYMLVTGSLDDFLNEYIINTLLTVRGSLGIKQDFMEMAYLFANPVRFTILTIGILGGLMFSQQVTNYKWVPLLCFLWFVFIGTKHTYLTLFSCYFIPSALFFLFFNIVVADRLEKLLYNNVAGGALVLGLMFFVVGANLIKFVGATPLSPDLFIYNRDNRKAYYDAAYLMSQIKNPTYINWDESQEMGIGLPANSLPGTKYWTLQAGYTSQMKISQKKAVASKTADFIIIPVNNKYNYHKALLLRFGYKPYYRWHHPMFGIQQEIYSKHHLSMPAKDFHVSNMDVLLKHSFDSADK